jgi:hypothetical protein
MLMRALGTARVTSPLTVAPWSWLLPAAPTSSAPPPLKFHGPPKSVAPSSVMLPVLVAPLLTFRPALLRSVSDSALTRLRTVRVPEIWMFGLAPTLMVTSSLAPGTVFVDQLAGSCQSTPSPAPVQATALRKRRGSSDSYTVAAAARAGRARVRREAGRACARSGRTERVEGCTVVPFG